MDDGNSSDLCDGGDLSEEGNELTTDVVVTVNAVLVHIKTREGVVRISGRVNGETASWVVYGAFATSFRVGDGEVESESNVFSEFKAGQCTVGAVEGRVNPCVGAFMTIAIEPMGKYFVGIKEML